LETAAGHRIAATAVIIAAGERIKIEHQYLIGYAWVALIVLRRRI